LFFEPCGPEVSAGSSRRRNRLDAGVIKITSRNFLFLVQPPSRSFIYTPSAAHTRNITSKSKIPLQGDHDTMKLTPECIPCLLYRALYEAKLTGGNNDWEVIRESIHILEDHLPETAGLAERPVSAELATILHRKVYDILGTNDPYKELKERSNEVALSLLPTAESFIKEARDPFEAAVVCSIVGNLLDFGIRSSAYTPEKLAERFQALTGEGLHVNHTRRLKGLLKERGEVLYFTDNCGEIVFDTLLLKEIKTLGVGISLVVRGEPILTDATMEDVLELGIDKLVGSVYTTGTYAVGVNFDALPEGVTSRMARGVPILAKGMANFESFSEEDYRPLAYLMRTKCKPVADALGFGKDMNVAVLFE